MIKCVIIEDELNSQKILEKFLTQYCDNVEILGFAKSVKDGFSLIQESKPDLVFLDIELDDGNGFDLIEKFSPFEFLLVFTTGYDKYSVRAVKSMAIEYILKPYSILQIQNVVARAAEIKETWNLINNIERGYNNPVYTTKEELLKLKNGKKNHLVSPSEILYIKADDPYCMIYMKDSSVPILVHIPLKSIQSQLPYFFFKSHRSYLVNLFEVKSWDGGRGGLIQLNNGNKVPIAFRQKKEFRLKIKAIRG